MIHTKEGTRRYPIMTTNPVKDIPNFTVPMPSDYAVLIAGALANWNGTIPSTDVNLDIPVSDFERSVVYRFALLLTEYAESNIIESVTDSGLCEIEKFLNRF